jgi:hypothetical protein
MPVRLPAKVARPPVAFSWPAVSAVMVSAVVAPSPMPATTSAAPARVGCGVGERRLCDDAARPFWRFPEPAAVCNGLAAEAAHVFT